MEGNMRNTFSFCELIKIEMFRLLAVRAVFKIVGILLLIFVSPETGKACMCYTATINNKSAEQ
jgi:hypothetical protein